MNARRFGYGATAVAASVLIWAAATWPVAKEFARAIPFTNWNHTTQAVHPLTAGDHLQLLYHFWLGADAAAERSPFFTNVYEFNTGDDAERGLPGFYYLPFSAVHWAVSGRWGQAAGWNAAGLASALTGLLFLVLLARRWAGGKAWAGLAAGLVAGTLPYRWITLLCGSPTGFGMAFPPMLAWGLDRAVRGGKASGWAWAVAAMAFAYTSDLHVFYFSALAAGPWCLLCWGMAVWEKGRGGARGGWKKGGVAAARKALRALVPVLPLAILAGGALAWAARHASGELEGSTMAGGRTVMEMAAYSPSAEGLWDEAADGMGRHVFVGWPMAALGAVAVLLGTGPRRWRRKGAEVPGWALWALAGMSLVVVLVALGINGWPCGFWARAARKTIPKFAMIRQTAKILCLLPPLAAAGLGLAFGGIFVGRRGGKKGREATGPARWIPGLGAWTAGVLALLAALTNLEQLRAGLCVLPGRLSAYEAVAADAAASGLSPEEIRAVSLPLWPGDSHWSSLYEYATTESGIRHLNGYAPATPAGYKGEVFARFESLNQGFATEEQWDGLLELGIRYVLFHGNAWEEKVSPWPPAATLRRLAGDSRLRLLNGESEGQVFAFRILARGEAGGAEEGPNWEDGVWGAARQWDFGEEGRRVEAGGGMAFTQRAPVFPAPGLRLMMRLAEPQPSPMGVDLEGKRAALAGQSEGLPGWQTLEWLSPKGVRARGESGAFTVRRAYLAAGPDWEADGDGVRRAAPAVLWHSGTSRPGEAGVTFSPETTGAGVALWGPNLAVPAGTYEARVVYEAEAEGNGFSVRRTGEAEKLAEVALPAGRGVASTGPLVLDDSPVRFEVVYRGKGRLRVEGLELAPARFELTVRE